MRILGLDPGLATVGYGVIELEEYDTPEFETCGVIRTPADDSLPERLDIINQSLSQLLDKTEPDRAGIEELYFNKNVKTALKVGEARGVLNLTLYQQGVEISEYNPGTIKQTVAGHGSADKIAVQESVQRDLDLNAVPEPDDAADALAVALCDAYHTQSGLPT